VSIGDGLSDWCGSGSHSQHLAEHSPDHLTRCHSPTPRNGFQFHSLPEREQEGELNDFLVHPVRVGSDRVE